MTKKWDYEAFYERVGRRNGWDFSTMKVVSDTPDWDFYEEVIRCTQTSDLLLDIGTGGGEAVLSIAGHAHLLVGIDLAQGMIDTARRNLEKAASCSPNVSNVRFVQMHADHLQFPNEFFNTASCRHSVFSASEVYRVLAEDGIFLTQQVSEHDKLNIAQAFGRGQHYGIKPGALLERYRQELAHAGFRQIEVREYNVMEYYAAPEDLLFLLMHTPIVPHFGENASDLETFKQFVQEHRYEKGIRTNSARFMITAKK
ncbi:class I SAM-dependent methyltransferase [Paenibacillus barcinonensis]|uniref:class I SAM-dependent methyltransferase n=1 Tax=Paenibacillus TaxID=44249 RepID=UPI001C121B11|nr:MULTISPECIES: class I SAM-dependent methyltransferase [Paenibacillus]MBU5354611.1 class I SAM-dependent methyltransferase [Paenibacillus barcinonensis]MDM5279786.1 class I SAM-dependent methyltransferase [Paenibacillus silvae]